MSSEVKFAQLRNGVRLAYVEQGDPNGPAIVLLHGTSDTHRSWDLMRPFLPASWRVIAVTQRGHGASDKPQSGYDIGDFASDVIELFDVLGVDQAVLVGHSMGSTIALRAAASAPERLAALVLVGAFADFESPEVGELADAVSTFEDPVDPAFVRAFQESTLANPIPEAFLELAIAESLRLPARAWRGAIKGMLAADPYADALKVRARSAIIWGDRDGFCPREHQVRLSSALPACRLLTLDGVGHAIQWERPEETAELLRSFVAAAVNSSEAGEAA